jgi:hypothetical protein
MRPNPVTEDDLPLESEVAGPVRDEAIDLRERAFVEQEIEALMRGELPLRVLGGDARLAAALLRLGALALKEVEFVRSGHGRKIADARARGSGPVRTTPRPLC